MNELLIPDNGWQREMMISSHESTFQDFMTARSNSDPDEFKSFNDINDETSLMIRLSQDSAGGD